MKKFLSIIALTVLAVGVVTSAASALSFDFGGAFTFSDMDNDGFAELLDFNTSILGKSFVVSADPALDAVLDVGSYVKLSLFTLNADYSFQNNAYENGFQVYDSNNNLLMEADITLDPLEIDQTTASINASFGLNLTNIDLKVAGSPILDAFALPAPGGAVNFTLNVANVDFDEMLKNGGGKGSYSGSAAPVPEPSTVLLLGAGILGMLAIARKRLNK